MRDEARLVRPTHLGVAMPIHTTRAFVMKGALAWHGGSAHGILLSARLSCFPTPGSKPLTLAKVIRTSKEPAALNETRYRTFRDYEETMTARSVELP